MASLAADYGGLGYEFTDAVESNFSSPEQSESGGVLTSMGTSLMGAIGKVGGFVNEVAAPGTAIGNYVSSLTAPKSPTQSNQTDGNTPGTVDGGQLGTSTLLLGAAAIAAVGVFAVIMLGKK